MTAQTQPDLTAEESFLWACARSWRQPDDLTAPPALDWERVVAVAQDNRMQTLLARVLAERDLLGRLPDDSRAALLADRDRLRQSAELLGDALRRYLRLAAERGIPTVVLKGLSVSLNVYGDAAMRPGGDIDILVRPADVAACLEILDGMGVGRYWPNLMDDAYYARHHLHQQRCTPDLRVWFEIHWALDHPLSLLTVDYEAMMARATPGALLGEPVHDLALPDLILSLAIHLVKHAVYLPSISGRPDLPRTILADGMLMYFLDVAEVVKRHAAEIDWLQFIALCRASGAVDLAGAVLRACHAVLGAPVPDWVLTNLPVRGPGAITRRAMTRVAEYETTTYLGQQPSRLWEFLLVTNGAFILRPIRALDLAGYLFPGRDFLRRRYGQESLGAATGHVLRAVGQYARLGFDTVAFAWERYRRLKALNQSASLFNRLDTNA